MNGSRKNEISSTWKGKPQKTKQNKTKQTNKKPEIVKYN